MDLTKDRVVAYFLLEDEDDLGNFMRVFGDLYAMWRSIPANTLSAYKIVDREDGYAMMCVVIDNAGPSHMNKFVIVTQKPSDQSRINLDTFLGGSDDTDPEAPPGEVL